MVQPPGAGSAGALRISTGQNASVDRLVQQSVISWSRSDTEATALGRHFWLEPPHCPGDALRVRVAVQDGPRSGSADCSTRSTCCCLLTFKLGKASPISATNAGQSCGKKVLSASLLPAWAQRMIYAAKAAMRPGRFGRRRRQTSRLRGNDGYTFSEGASLAQPMASSGLLLRPVVSIS